MGHTGAGGLFIAAVLVFASVLLDVLTVVYLFVNRVVGGVLYVSALVLGAAAILLLGPRVFREFVADEIVTDPLTWFIRFSFLFVLAAPYIKARRRRRGRGVHGAGTPLERP
jgi:hypothetical protein